MKVYLEVVASVLGVLAISSIFVGFCLNHGNDRRYGFFLTRLRFVKVTIGVAVAAFVVCNAVFEIAKAVALENASPPSLSLKVESATTTPPDDSMPWTVKEDEGAKQSSAKQSSNEAEVTWQIIAFSFGCLEILLILWLAARIARLFNLTQRNMIIHRFLWRSVFTADQLKQGKGWVLLRQLSVAASKEENAPYALAVWEAFVKGLINGDILGFQKMPKKLSIIKRFRAFCIQGYRLKTPASITDQDRMERAFFATYGLCEWLVKETPHTLSIVEPVFCGQIIGCLKNTYNAAIIPAIRQAQPSPPWSPDIYAGIGFLLGLSPLNPAYHPQYIRTAIAYFNNLQSSPNCFFSCSLLFLSNYGYNFTIAASKIKTELEKNLIMIGNETSTANFLASLNPPANIVERNMLIDIVRDSWMRLYQLLKRSDVGATQAEYITAFHNIIQDIAADLANVASSPISKIMQLLRS